MALASLGCCLILTLILLEPFLPINLASRPLGEYEVQDHYGIGHRLTVYYEPPWFGDDAPGSLSLYCNGKRWLVEEGVEERSLPLGDVHLYLCPEQNDIAVLRRRVVRTQPVVLFSLDLPAGKGGMHDPPRSFEDLGWEGWWRVEPARRR